MRRRRNSPARARSRHFEVPLDDSWARDMGPTFLRAADGTRAAVQWRFNAWGNKYHPYDEDAKLAPRASQRPWMRGSITRRWSAKAAQSIATARARCSPPSRCLLNPNRNPEPDAAGGRGDVSRSIPARGAMIWLGEGFSDDETDGHIDNIACFVGAGPRARRRAVVASRIPTTSR